MTCVSCCFCVHLASCVSRLPGVVRVMRWWRCVLSVVLGMLCWFVGWFAVLLEVIYRCLCRCLSWVHFFVCCFGVGDIHICAEKCLFVVWLFLQWFVYGVVGLVWQVLWPWPLLCDWFGMFVWVAWRVYVVMVWVLKLCGVVFWCHST